MSSDTEKTVRITRGSARSVTPSAQFAPGTLIGGRYRIASLLGSGGMGEVYRADDLKLDQPVALKFLPAAIATDERYLDQLHDEVRLGRQIAHPNVCRIYDIGEADGAHFVAMEYVDGEDLGRLLRRIGRLAHDKAVEIARGVAAGLAAAHAKGILHRDLKPANIMIDSRGDARITDFGLALAREDAGDALSAGTPAYMAPEQLAGRAASVQSDVYALGLVMYEIFTAQRARGELSLAELRRNETPIETPSSIVRDIDPAVERLLLRCLESDPNLRPRSAREVYEALPGGDRLAAALAAGETPSPRAVAAAGVEGALSPRVAWSILGAIAAMVAVILLVAQPWSVDRIAAMEIPPAALEARAIEIGKAIGIAPQRFRVSGCFARHDYESWLGDQSRAGLRARSVRGFALVAMRVRESPAPITPVGLQPLALDDPPQTQPGEATIDVDMSGRLAGLQAVPRAGPPAAVDWQQVLALTGVAPSSVRPTPPLQTPPVYADTRVAWNAWYPTAPDVPVHIEAAAAAGRTVWLKIGGDWEKDKSRRNVIFAGPALTGVAMALLGGVIVLLLLLAWNNYRKRRGDRAGAMRVASVIFVLEAITYQLLARHQLNAGHELVILTQTATASLFTAAMFAFIYLTLEPYVRRTWPERVISWSRLVGGNLRDPMVGRDILLGLAAGVAHAFVANCANLPAIVRGETLVPHIHPWQVTSAAEVLGVITNDVSGSALTGLLFVFVLVALTIVLRRRSWAVAALVLLQVAAFTAASRGKIPVLIGFLVITAIYTVTVLRVGLLGIAALQFAFSLMFQLPLPGAPGSWLFPLGFIPLIALVVLTLWAFRTSLGGQPAFNLD